MDKDNLLHSNRRSVCRPARCTGATRRGGGREGGQTTVETSQIYVCVFKNPKIYILVSNIQAFDMLGSPHVVRSCRSGQVWSCSVCSLHMHWRREPVFVKATAERWTQHTRKGAWPTERKTKQQGSPGFHLSRRRQAGSSIKVTQLNSKSIVWRGESESVWLQKRSDKMKTSPQAKRHNQHSFSLTFLNFHPLPNIWHLVFSYPGSSKPTLAAWLTHCQFGYKEWILRLEGPSA